MCGYLFHADTFSCVYYCMQIPFHSDTLLHADTKPIRILLSADTLCIRRHMLQYHTCTNGIFQVHSLQTIIAILLTVRLTKTKLPMMLLFLKSTVYQSKATTFIWMLTAIQGHPIFYALTATTVVPCLYL